MKKERMGFNLLFLVIVFIFFTCIFNTSLFAATCVLPGDFCGPMGDPTPDGKVNFDDLMVFATAYGSETGDPNWNALCDICGYLGDPSPDSKVNFDDLMVFATNYGRSCPTTWTVMVYMDGDNNLEYYEWLILDRMESVGSTAEVNILAQVDPYDDCAGTYRYYITGTDQGISYPLYSDDIVQTMPEQNMSDPAVLTEFINWAGDNYPADHYILVLSDHGAGWREEDEIFKGIIWDDTTGGWEHIDIPELAQSLQNANIGIDILVLDACNMQMIEVAYELGMQMTSVPNYLIASETTGWINGIPYDNILNQLTSNPGMAQLAICETIVNEYVDNLTDTGKPTTMSALQFNNEFLTDTLGIINDFSTALMASSYQEEISSARSMAQSYELWDRPQYKDLYDFAQIIKNNVSDCQIEAQAVMDLVNSIIVAEGHTGLGVDNSHGLSIYLIDSSAEYDSSYDLLQFAMDTQWDEFLVSAEGVITGVQITPVTRQVSTGLAPEALSSFEEEINPLMDYQIANINDGLKGETVNAIDVLWDAYYDVDGYRVYRKVNSGDYTLLYEWQNPPTGSFGYGFYDYDISEGNTYSYYVTAYGPDWETAPSEIASIEITAQTFLPPCSLISPTDNSAITETSPVFSWNPVGLGASELPYGEVYSGSTFLRIYDANTYEWVWNIRLNDMTTSMATFNQDGMADPLVPGNTYRWYIVTNGYDNNGFYVSSSFSETWEFNYDGENVVTGVWAYTITSEGGVTPPDASINMSGFKSKNVQLSEESKLFSISNFNRFRKEKGEEKNYTIQLEWDGFIDASGYKVYRSNGENYSVIHDELDVGIDNYYFYDVNTLPENTYSYYITAYGSDWETAPSQTVTRDTWLLPCSLISPVNSSIVTNPNPIFAWNPVGISTFPYGSIYSGDSHIWVYDHITTQDVWERILYDDMTTSTISYDDDGQAIPLVLGHNYTWNYYALGFDEYGNIIAGSLAEGWDMFAGWDFTYE
jgi:hypothetical protein